MVDQDTGASYTLKRYQSTKTVDPDSGWHHASIVLKPLNPDYEDIVVAAEEAEEYRVVAFLVEVLTVEI